MLFGMRSVQPNADLPPSNSHTMLGYNSLPSRPQRTTLRNMTGIYLGSDSNSRVSTHTRHSIPPLAKPRGVCAGTRANADRRRQPGQAGLDSNTGQLGQGLKGTSTCDHILDPDCISKTLLYIYHQPTPAPIALPYTPPMILHLPNLRPKQQQRVEALRMREEPRGFNPLPLKKPNKPKTSRKGEDHICSSSGKHALDYSGITRKTRRNFVPVANSGVKRLEDLRTETSNIITGSGSIRNGCERNLPHPSPVLPEKPSNISKKQLIGLEDCYKKICKGNLSNLQNLMLRKQGVSVKTRARVISTPLTIRSFRNPQSPHSVVQYSDPKHRPNSIAETVTRPPVPAPYYYNSKALPRTADVGSNRIRLTRGQVGVQNLHGAKVLAAPGVGVISGSAFRNRWSIPRDNSGFEGRPPSGIAGVRPPCLGSNTKIFDSDEMFVQRDGFKVPSGTPAASQTDLHKMDASEDMQDYSGNNPTEMIIKPSFQTTVPPPSPTTQHRSKVYSSNKNNCGSDYDSEFDTRDGVESTVSIPTIGTRPETRGEYKLADSGIEEQDEGDETQGRMKVSIVISIEDEMGRHIDVNIEDEAGQMDVETPASSDYTPVTNKGDVTNACIPSLSEEIAGIAQEAAIQKQSELQRLIEEHNELVLHIEELEKMKPTFSDDDLSSSDDETPMAVATTSLS